MHAIELVKLPDDIPVHYGSYVGGLKIQTELQLFVASEQHSVGFC
jgi:hypothetical protein